MDQKKRAVNPLLRLVPLARPHQDGDGDFGLVRDHELRVEPEQLAQVVPAVVAHRPWRDLEAVGVGVGDQVFVPEKGVVLRPDVVHRKAELCDVIHEIGLVVILL